MRKKEKGILFEPVAGLTILGAFVEAIGIAKKNNKPVHAIINDIEVDVTAKTKAPKAVAIYQRKLKARYEAECRSYQRRQAATRGK